MLAHLVQKSEEKGGLSSQACKSCYIPPKCDNTSSYQFAVEQVRGGSTRLKAELRQPLRTTTTKEPEHYKTEELHKSVSYATAKFSFPKFSTCSLKQSLPCVHMCILQTQVMKKLTVWPKATGLFMCNET